MNTKGLFISTLIVIDTFLGAYFYGVHSRAIKVIDPSLPAVNKEEVKQEIKQQEANSQPIATPAKVQSTVAAATGKKIEPKKEEPHKKDKAKKQKSKTKNKKKEKK